MQLSKTYIDSLEYKGQGKTSQYHWDTGRVPRFGLRIYPSGSKSFVLRYRFKGRQRELIIGPYGPVTLAQALKIASQKYIEIKSGGDPQNDKMLDQLGGTIEKLAETYMTKYAKVRKRSWAKDEQYLRNWILPKLGKTPVRSVNRAQIARFHAGVGQKHPVTANRCLSLLSKMFSEAIKWGVLPENAANPASKVQKFKEVSRDRFISRHEELPIMARAINRQPELIRGMIWLYLLTGLRKSELLRLKWVNVDLSGRKPRLKVEQTKAGKPHYLPLSKLAVREFVSLPRLHGNPYVFPGARKGDHRRDFRKSWTKILTETGFENLTPHDLRRTVGSYLAEQGASLAQIGEVLGQRSPKTTLVYARFGNEPIQRLLEDHSRLLEDVIDLGEEDFTDLNVIDAESES